LPVAWPEVADAVAAGDPARLRLDADQVVERVVRLGESVAEATALL